MGGIGKTTLARNLYSDSLIEYHFDIHAWVVLSQDYDVKLMFTSLVCSTGEPNGELNHKSIEELAERFVQKFEGTAQKDWECIAEDERTAATNGGIVVYFHKAEAINAGFSIHGGYWMRSQLDSTDLSNGASSFKSSVYDFSNNFQISEPYVLGKIIEVHCGRIWSLVTSIVI
ncbi:UNVERIFIED_CONTAM: putative inactive disease susceptibility protein LOV1 [Sesamum calycinum]|uniref:Inactive disease susceptibility protein LOV1 n=1 Tax=Sesamum calycinum TaxID=2727403 RepID=A0AAW2SDR6_9LAMI